MDSVLLREAALKLSPFERVQLIDMLWQSLEPAHQAEIDQAWLKESSDRLNAYQRVDMKAVDGESVLSELKEKLSRGRNIVFLLQQFLQPKLPPTSMRLIVLN